MHGALLSEPFCNLCEPAYLFLDDELMHVRPARLLFTGQTPAPAFKCDARLRIAWHILVVSLRSWYIFDCSEISCSSPQASDLVCRPRHRIMHRDLWDICRTPERWTLFADCQGVSRPCSGAGGATG